MTDLLVIFNATLEYLATQSDHSEHKTSERSSCRNCTLVRDAMKILYDKYPAFLSSLWTVADPIMTQSIDTESSHTYPHDHNSGCTAEGKCEVGLSIGQVLSSCFEQFDEITSAFIYKKPLYVVIGPSLPPLKRPLQE